MGAIYNKAHHARIPIPKSSERIEMHARCARASVCLCTRAYIRGYIRGRETGWEWIERDGQTGGGGAGRSVCISTHMRAGTHTCTRTRTHERAGGRGDGEGSGEEGFITRDLLLLPGGGKPLQRATAMHTYARAGCVYPIRAHTYAHRGETSCASRFLATAVCRVLLASRYVARN